MTIPVADLEAGKCYLAKGEKVSQVRRVLQVMPDGRVRYERRVKSPNRAQWGWVSSLSEGRAFASQVLREVPCDWTVEGEP